jgi:hypothetical protein
METIPRLVDLKKYNFAQSKVEINPFVKTVKKLNLNKILLIGFILFSIFFLYNCRYGIFRYNNNGLCPLMFN